MFRNRAFQIAVMSVLFAGLMVAFTVAAPDDAPATTPATTSGAATTATTAESAAAAPANAAPAKLAEITPDAKPLLEKLATAYKDLKALTLAGTLGGDFNVDGQKSNEKIEMTGSFAAPNLFRHAMKDDLLAGSTGEQLFIYEGGRKLYRAVEAKKERTPTTELPPPFDRVLLDQNLSLALALSSDPAGDLAKLYAKIGKAADVTIDGKAHAALELSNEHETVTLALDPQTNLVRRASFDIAKSLKKRGAQDVAKAVLTMDYVTSTAGGDAKPEQFAWTPPAGARDVATIQAGGETEMAAVAMVGKPAPDFKLKDVNGKDVTLADLRGDVLVFDFWATWCPPCVAAMPGLNELAAAKKEQGLKVVALNQDEPQDLVQGFVNSRKLDNLIVLLDAGGKVATDYMATDVLPTTMVIGRDGTVRKVITTFGPEGEKDLRAAVDEALRASK